MTVSTFVNLKRVQAGVRSQKSKKQSISFAISAHQTVYPIRWNNVFVVKNSLILTNSATLAIAKVNFSVYF